MPSQTRRTTLMRWSLATSANAYGQPPTAPKPGADIFIDGEKFIGCVERPTNSSVLFTSDMAGEVPVNSNKVREPRSNQKFAASLQDVKVRRNEDSSKAPQGTVTAAWQKVEVTGAVTQTVPTGNLGNLIRSRLLTLRVSQISRTYLTMNGAKCLRKRRLHCHRLSSPFVKEGVCTLV